MFARVYRFEPPDLKRKDNFFSHTTFVCVDDQIHLMRTSFHYLKTGGNPELEDDWERNDCWSYVEHCHGECHPMMELPSEAIRLAEKAKSWLALKKNN